MHKALFLFLATTTLLHTASFGKDKKTKAKRFPMSSTVSVFANFSSAKVDFASKPSLLTTKNKATNGGVEVTTDFYVLPYNMYLTTGLRMAEAGHEMRVGTNLPGLDPQQSFVNYKLIYGHYSIPIRVGKTIKFSKKSNAHANVFAGASFGVSGIDAITVESGLAPSGPDGDKVSSGENYPDPKGFKFYSSADIGFRVAPFNFPNLSIGLMASFDLTKSGEFSSTGYFSNDTRNLRNDYVLQSNPTFFNLMVSVNYTFGKSWKRMLSGVPAVCK